MNSHSHNPSVRRPYTREPSGLLDETARVPVVMKMLDLVTLDFLRMIQSPIRKYRQFGVTTALVGQ